MADVTWDDTDDSVTWNDTDADITWNATTTSAGTTITYQHEVNIG